MWMCEESKAMLYVHHLLLQRGQRSHSLPLSPSSFSGTVTGAHLTHSVKDCALAAKCGPWLRGVPLCS